jgi:hypothetical protein
MSEFMNAKNGRNDLHWQLLMSASALALVTSLSAALDAKADDAGRPTVWIEFGAQSEQVSGFGDPLNLQFTHELVADGFKSPQELQRSLSQSFGGESRLSFEPESSDWVFSISALYGRASATKGTHQQTPGGPRHVSFVTSSGTLHTGTFAPLHGTAKFSEPHIDNSETHTILDFQAGKEMGLGLFNGGKSLISFGVRFAQFTSKQDMTLKADPDFYFPLDIFHNPKYHHTYSVTSHLDRSFRGLGPSVSWKASAPVIGNIDNGGVALDWGMNAALLFGRQKTIGHHQTVGTFYKSNEVQKYHFTSHIHRTGSPDRSRSVIAPNIGGFAGVSFLYSNAKVSLGYRADFFFGAMDGGIDAAKKENVGFYGPFATISVGFRNGP